MKKISILVPYEAVPASIVDPRYMFTAVNQFLKSDGKEPFFDIKLVGLAKDVSLNEGSFSVHVDATIEEVQKTDLIIVPAIAGDFEKAIKLNEPFFPWIERQYHQGAEVASLCVGAFLLASTGLLDGKKCSTHWLFIEKFKEMFPTVTIEDGSIVTEEHRLYSSGGASSYWNLLLHLVEKYTARTMAIRASKFFALEIERKSQAPFIIFNGQKSHEDEEVKRAQEFIENNLSERFTIDTLASQFAIGRRNFERRFKKATNNTPIEYIQRVKIEAAKKSLELSRKTISETMFDVGYTDAKAFREVFKKITGMTPVEYRNKYNKELVG